MWINSSWSDGFIKLSINHTHSYNDANINYNQYREIRCSSCNHRFVDDLYNINSLGIITSLNYNCSGHLSVPQTIDGVTTIGLDDELFINHQSLVSVTLPNTIQFIGEGAFSNCSSLESINIPYGVVLLPRLCFYDCYNLEKIELPSSVSSIGV